ncbi:hypothetical protein ACEN88_00585 [Massilia sp. CT11-108]|uniref:hypothetical protein n=1 Tax=Massilia sp. CT11-108 TaxID=3393900 RepID=UPI0039A73A83
MHRTFLEVYLQQLGARTIVLEPAYIDKDFLHDYTGYYVSCFHNYRRVTARLHFFSSEFTQEHFVALLSGEASPLSIATLQDSYLGFVVVKPLPQTIIGRTCLKTYPSEKGRRNFPVVQRYTANLAGISLSVESLPFQEQDSVAAACATSALWSIFHATGRYFHHPILSPTEITKAGSASLPDGDMPNTRAFPNKGLTSQQMAYAINSVGLEPQVVGASHAHLVKSTLYAYMRGKIPVLFGIQLVDYDATGATPFRVIGRHAVAVAGYEYGTDPIVPSGQTGFRLASSRIGKIYVHDDQLGPFARMRFATVPGAHFGNPAPTLDVMKTEWRSNIPGGEVIALPFLMLLPLYKKIRIPFELIHDTILELDSFIEMVRAQFFAHLQRPEWDIYLTTGSDFKAEVLKDVVAGTVKDGLEILTASLPRFVWRATASHDNGIYCDFLFDATGIEQGALLVYAKVASPEFRTMFAPFAGNPVGGVQTRQIFKVLGTGVGASSTIFPP